MRVRRWQTTNEKQLVGALRQTQRTLNNLINNLPGFVYRCANDPDWTMLYVSDGCLELTGYPPEAFIGNKVIRYNDIIHPEHREWEGNQQNLRLGLPMEVEYRIITATGEVRWVWERGRAVFEGDQLLYIEGFVTGIDARKQMEIDLQAREAQYRHLFELSPDRILVQDIKGTVLQVNEAFSVASGYEPREVIGHDIRNFVPIERRANVSEHLARIAAGETLVHEVESLEKNGEIRRKLLRERAIPLGSSQIGVLSIATDIEDQLRTLESLQKSEARYRSLVECLLEGLVIVRFGGEIIFANPSAAVMLGVHEGESIHGLSALEFVHLNWQERVLQDFIDIDKGVRVTAEYQCRRRDGQHIWLEVHSTVVQYEGEEAMLLLLRDVTERRREREEREHLYWHDSLTGLHNRHYFEKVLGEGTTPCPGIVVADLNGLKLVNDTFGHVSGDELLRAVASMLKSHAPPDAICSRIGGDEFVVLLPCADDLVIDAYIEQLEMAIEEHNKQGTSCPLSVSFGYKASQDSNGSLFELFKAADDIMYREKLLQKQSHRSSFVYVLMGALESKNYETRAHVERMEELAVSLARAIDYPESSMLNLVLFAKFHDIGKVGVSDSILLKPGLLTDTERTEMRRHSEIGHRIALGSPELAPVADLILRHHEWWNGGGYPGGLSGNDIPLPCRIVAIADAFDAMTSDRPYRRAMPVEAAVRELKAFSGTQFEPALVEAFLRSQNIE